MYSTNHVKIALIGERSDTLIAHRAIPLALQLATTAGSAASRR